MHLDDWRFSAKRAWQNSFIRWTILVDGLVILASSAFMLWRLIPAGLRTGVLVMHYNVYLGIDSVQAWPWIIAVPAVMLLAFTVNTLLALGVYRPDELAAKALVSLSAALTAVWCIAGFFLLLMNI